MAANGEAPCQDSQGVDRLPSLFSKYLGGVAACGDGGRAPKRLEWPKAMQA